MNSQTAIKINEISSVCPLPAEGCELQTFSDIAVVSSVPIHLAGFATSFDGECVTGSAAALDEAPFLRAYMELVERLSMLVSMRSDHPITLRDVDGVRIGLVPPPHVFLKSTEPERWNWARSNGVAIAPSWKEAAARARWELIERDRILRSFYGEIAPRRLSAEFEQIPAALGERYTFEAYAFGAPWDGSTHVAALFGFPHGRGDPLVCGFGARGTLEDAVTVATAECLQRLGFLFGEAIPEGSPLPSPTPDFHQEYFLFPRHHDVLRRWLCGEHERFRGCMNPAYAGSPQEPRYADLTPSALEGRLFVARALPNGHLPLAFGVGLPLLAPCAPDAVAVHPIA